MKTPEQMGADDLSAPEQTDATKDQLTENENSKSKEETTEDERAIAAERMKKMDEAKIALLRIYMLGEKINPFDGRWPKDDILKPAKKALSELSAMEQKELAIDFFDDTIGRNISNNKNAYSVYGVFKNTPFGEKFKQLEDERLKAAGFGGGFNL